MTDQFPQMLFKVGGAEQVQLPGAAGGYRVAGFRTRIVDDVEAFDASVAAGWAESPAAAEIAVEAYEAATEDASRQARADEAEGASPRPSAREALERQATDLHIKFDGRTSSKKLAAMVADKLKG